MDYTTFVEDSCPGDCYCKDVCPNCNMNFKQAGEELCAACILEIKKDEIRASVEEKLKEY